MLIHEKTLKHLKLERDKYLAVCKRKMKHSLVPHIRSDEDQEGMKITSHISCYHCI